MQPVYRCWGSELRSSIMHSKHHYPRHHLLNHIFILKISLLRNLVTENIEVAKISVLKFRFSEDRSLQWISNHWFYFVLLFIACCSFFLKLKDYTVRGEAQNEQDRPRFPLSNLRKTWGGHSWVFIWCDAASKKGGWKETKASTRKRSYSWQMWVEGLLQG